MRGGPEYLWPTRLMLELVALEGSMLVEQQATLIDELGLSSAEADAL